MKNVDIATFQKTVWGYYKKHGRHDLPWRPNSRGARTAKKNLDPYKILVSEIMLQQTQVDRVIPKYKAFLKKFPNARVLARAVNVDVLKEWSGLGYNRRALFLKRAAEIVVREYRGRFPRTPEELEKLPGVGPYTARAVATFSYGGSYTFIETNIRSVFIHEFFRKKKVVDDKVLFPIIEATLPLKKSTREWYYGLMDYGVYLKKTFPNPNRKSAHYTKQSTFKGSVRELRGEFVRKCMAKPILKNTLLASYTKTDCTRAKKALTGLIADRILDLDSRGYVKIRNNY